MIDVAMFGSYVIVIEYIMIIITLLQCCHFDTSELL